MAIESARLLKVSMFAIKIRNVCRDCFTEAEGCVRLCATGVFPLGFTWQAIIVSRLFREPFAKFLCVVPRNSFNRQVLPLESARRQVFHDRFPLSLCDEVPA